MKIAQIVEKLRPFDFEVKTSDHYCQVLLNDVLWLVINNVDGSVDIHITRNNTFEYHLTIPEKAFKKFYNTCYECRQMGNLLCFAKDISLNKSHEIRFLRPTSYIAIKTAQLPYTPIELNEKQSNLLMSVLKIIHENL